MVFIGGANFVTLLLCSCPSTFLSCCFPNANLSELEECTTISTESQGKTTHTSYRSFFFSFKLFRELYGYCTLPIVSLPYTLNHMDFHFTTGIKWCNIKKFFYHRTAFLYSIIIDYVLKLFLSIIHMENFGACLHEFYFFPCSYHPLMTEILVLRAPPSAISDLSKSCRHNLASLLCFHALIAFKLHLKFHDIHH